MGIGKEGIWNNGIGREYGIGDKGIRYNPYTFIP